MTFAQCVDGFIRDNESSWTNPKHRHKWKTSLVKYVYPALGNRMSPKEWNEAGKPDIVERATAKKKEILTTYYPDYIPEAIDDLIRAKHDIKLPREVMRIGDPRWFK